MIVELEAGVARLTDLIFRCGSITTPKDESKTLADLLSDLRAQRLACIASGGIDHNLLESLASRVGLLEAHVADGWHLYLVTKTLDSTAGKPYRSYWGNIAKPKETSFYEAVKSFVSFLVHLIIEAEKQGVECPKLSRYFVILTECWKTKATDQIVRIIEDLLGRRG